MAPKRKHLSSASSPPKKRKHKHKSLTLVDAVSQSSDLAAPALFQKARLKIHVAVPPATLLSLSTYLHSHLTSTLLLKHAENGTIVAFSDFNSLPRLGRVLDECPFSWSWFEGNVLLFNPRIGQRICTSLASTWSLFRFWSWVLTGRVDGTVVLSSPDHIALLSYALFNVSIPRSQLPKDWTYDTEESHWVDGEGMVIEGDLEFEVTQYTPPFKWQLTAD
jgi:hypothetical protein